MKVVLDTNVLLSALLIQGGTSPTILRQFRDNKWVLVISGEIIEEYGEVLGRPRFGLPKHKIGAMLNEIQRRSIMVIPSKRHRAVDIDPDDNEFVDVAVEAQVDYLVSGDRHLLEIKLFRGIPIVTPAAFLTQNS